MSNISNAKGGCLCGKVNFTAAQINNGVGACHCNMCRKWGGGPLMAVDCGQNVEFTNDENISIYDSSAWAERGFCKYCGSHLFYRLKENKQYIMPAGLFENDDNLVFDHQVFIDEKPHFYSFSNATKDMTGAEVFTKFAPPEK